LIDLAFEKGAHSNMVLEALFGHYEVTGRKDLIKKALNKGAKFSGIRTHNFHRFPSLEEAKMMFANKNNSVDTDEFLYWILKTDCKAHNYDEQEMVISDELLELQSNLIDLAFANGVNLSKIGFSEGLPTHRACEKLIEHGMKPDDLVKQLARVILITTKEKNLQTGEWEDVYKLNDKDIAERDSLIKFAIEKGAKPTEPDNSWMLKILDLIRKIDDQLPNDYKRNSCNDDYITDFAGSIANEDGKTLLMLFAENGNFWLVKYFLDRKTTSSKEDNNGKTASMLAKDAGHTEIVKLLQAKEKPADPDEL
jgi:ankyrin repeat protein